MSNAGFGSGTYNPLAANYGQDLSCITDLDPAMVEVSGRLLLAQSCVRRLITPRGRLIDDANYGFDVTQFLNDDLSQSDIARIAASVDAELLKDERVIASYTTVSFALNTLTIATQMTPSAGPQFPLVLAVSSVTVALLAPTQ